MEKRNVLRNILTITALLLYSLSYCQSDSSWNVLVVKSGREISINEKAPYLFNKNGFYLHKNMLYHFELQDGSYTSGRLMDIKKDSLVVANCYNEKVAVKNYDSFWVKTFHYSKFKRLKIITDKSFTIWHNIELSDYDFLFKKTVQKYEVETRFCPNYYWETLDSCKKCPKCYYSLGKRKLELVKEVEGSLYYYSDHHIKADSLHTKRRNDTTWVSRNIIWLAPTGRNTKINGLAISAMAIPAYDVHELQIRGVNAELGIGMFVFPYLLMSMTELDTNLRWDSYEQNAVTTTISGASISLMGHFGQTNINGVSINGATGGVSTCNGVLASFGVNTMYKLNGLSITGIANVATYANGLQIGLVNKCRKLRGFQIGLINKNQKRTLPFINWCFKD